MTSLEMNASDNESQLSANPEQEEVVLKPAKRPKPKVNTSYKDERFILCYTVTIRGQNAR